MTRQASPVPFASQPMFNHHHKFDYSTADRHASFKRSTSRLIRTRNELVSVVRLWFVIKDDDTSIPLPSQKEKEIMI